MTSVNVKQIQENFPAELRALKAWCIWRYETRDGKQTKIPYRPVGIGRFAPASSTNTATWSSFEAVNVANLPDFGIGIFCDGAYTFIDLDKCIKDGEIEGWAQSVLARTDSYAEKSPSGAGLHIFVRGSLDKPGRKINGCEMYCRARFFTVTGERVSTSTVRDMPEAELEELREDIANDDLRPYPLEGSKPRGCDRLIVTQPRTFDERVAVLERALDDDLSDYNHDRSAAVYGVMQLLARKHQGDKEGVREEMEKSKLCAEWGDKWDRLGEDELDKGIANWKENGRPPWNKDDEHIFRSPAVQGGDDDYVLGPLPEQASDPVQEGQFPLGEVSLIGGTSGAGKSSVLYDVAERQRRGETIFGRPTYKRSSLIVLRDRGDRDVRLTFKRLGMDQNAIDYHVLTGADRNRPLGDVLGQIIDARELKPQLVVLEGLDLGVDGAAVKMEDVVPVMDSLQRVARHFHIAVVGTVGSPKLKVGEDFANERERLFGSGAWGRMSATVWILTCASKDASRVNLSMLGRHSKRQAVVLEWQRGKLIEVSNQQLEREEGLTMLDWMIEHGQFTKNDLRKQFSMSGGSVAKKIDGWCNAGVIKRHYKDAKEFYRVVSQPASTGVEVSG